MEVYAILYWVCRCVTYFATGSYLLSSQLRWQAESLKFLQRLTLEPVIAEPTTTLGREEKNHRYMVSSP